MGRTVRNVQQLRRRSHPWGSWLTCEETEAKAGTGTLQKDHGYVFEVFAGRPGTAVTTADHGVGPRPARGSRRRTVRRRVYLTEDASNPTGLLYRWTAPDGYKLKPYIAQALKPDDGTLEALAVLTGDGSVLPDLAYVTAAQIGRPFSTKWVNVPDRHASTHIPAETVRPRRGHPLEEARRRLG